MGWEESAVTIAFEAVKKFFDSKKDDKDLISIGLAVGYFYNFLEPLFKKIQVNGELEFYQAETDAQPQKFDIDNIKIHIIIPMKLDFITFDNCEKEYKQYSKGFVDLKQNNRYYGINYSINKLGKKDELVIVDYARPIKSIKPYYEDILKYSKAEKWPRIQLAEITAFIETIKKLQRAGYGIFPNMMDFIQRD